MDISIVSDYLDKIRERGMYNAPENNFNILEKGGNILNTLKERGEYHAPTNSFFDDKKIGEHIEKVMQEMVSSITKMPLLSSIGGIKPIYNTVRAISIGCISAIVAYKALKMLFAYDENEKIEGKNLLGRVAYSIVLGNLSIPLIDTMIKFNNTLINVLTSNFSLMPVLGTGLNKSYGILLTVALLLLELFCTLKIMIDFWMRMSELVFTGVISPIVFTMWINEQWSGYLKQWWKRITTLIFTQFCQVLILLLYSMLISGMALSGTLSGLCMAIGSLFLVINTPKILSGFMDSGTNMKSIGRTISGIKRGGLKSLIFK